MGTTSSSIHAIADEDSKFLAIPTRLMDSWMNKYASWREFVIKTYQSRFEELLHSVDSIAFHKLDERLWDYLLEAPKDNDKGVIKITHQEIANDLNSSREVISRLLKQLEKLGRVKLGRNTIELKD
jgi:CRP/FNR family transcriptional regulator